MSIEGIWSGEVYGPFGWETRGVFIFEKGRVMGGDNRQYTAGTYSVTGNRLKAELTVHYYGPPHTAFGEAREEITLQVEGEVGEPQIDAVLRRHDRPQYDLQFRLTKRMGLPKA